MRFLPLQTALLLCGCLFSLLPVGAQEPLPALPSGHPVRFNEHTLFFVYSPLGSYRPEERAQVIESRLRRLAEDPHFHPTMLRVEERGDRSEILANELTAATVTEEDARAAGRPRRELAASYTRTMQRAVESYRQEYSARSLLLGVLYSVGATTLLIALLALLSRIERLAARHLAAQRRPPPGRGGTLPARAYFRGYLADILLQALKLLRLAADAVLIYLYLTLLLGLFPWTRSYGLTLLRYTHRHLSLLGAALLTKLPDLLFMGVIVLIAYGILRLVHLIFSGIEKGVFVIHGLDAELAAPTYRIVRLLATALTIVAIFPYIPGSNSLAFQGVSVFIGALLTFGSSSVISNLIAGIVLTYMRPFRTGDRIKIGETTGHVIDKTDLVTRLRTAKNEVVSFPNALVLGAPTINYSALAETVGLILHTSVTIGYDAPWRQVHSLLIAAANGTDHILKEPPPFVLQTALNDFYVSYEINAYTDQPDRMTAIYSQLHQNIQDRFNEAGVEIMSPHYTSLRDGSPTTIPHPDTITETDGL